jgi:hypothetical protein
MSGSRNIYLAEVDAVCRHLLRQGEVKLAHRIRHVVAEWEHVCSVNQNKPAPTIAPFRPTDAERRPLDAALKEVRGSWSAAA